MIASLISSATVLVNEEVTITASVSGANLSNLTYAWVVTNMTDGTVSTYSDATVTAAFPCGTYSIGLAVGNGTEIGTFTASPFFEVKPAQGNYRLKSGSRCIDAGANLAWMAGATDLDGNARIYARRHIVDIGWYEFSRPVGMTLFLQ